MIISYKYSYLIGTFLFFILWIYFYLTRKDLRKQMLITGIILATIGPICEYLLWTSDWWHPETITGTRIGIEDFLLGISSGGITGVLYEGLLNKKYYSDKLLKRNIGALFIILVSIFSFFAAFYVLKINSFIATNIGFITATIILIFLRKDLIIPSSINGFFMVLIILPIYNIIDLLFPGWVNATWITKNLIGLRLMKIPIEDIIFYFVSAFTIPMFYKYWQGIKSKI